MAVNTGLTEMLVQVKFFLIKPTTEDIKVTDKTRIINCFEVCLRFSNYESIWLFNNMVEFIEKHYTY